MNAKVSRRLRKAVYNKGHHPGPVTYHQVALNSKTVVADPQRWAYQQAKARYVRGIK
jgi:hypothetical protein